MFGGKRGVAALSSIALVVVFSVLAIALSTIFFKYNQYMLRMREIEETIVLRNKENLRVNATSASRNVTLTVTNTGSVSATVEAVLFLDPEGTVNETVKLNPALTIKVRETTTITIPKNVTQNWDVGVLTQLGNVYWTDVQLTP